MKVDIYARKAVEELLKNDFPKNTAVISFYDPPNIRTGEISKPVDYKGKPERLFAAAVHDIDIDILEDYGLTFDTYFPEAESLAEFIRQAHDDGLDIICQCEYGQSRRPPAPPQFWSIIAKTVFRYLPITDTTRTN